ncbi:MAG: hypothetical protein NTU53_06750 [Planctomycetota bacterium]|nr:hypothetical protein [Planctomycetota bacterium]
MRSTSASKLRRFFLGICLMAAMGANPAIAGLSVSPLKQEVSLKPGEEGKVRITLTNNIRNGPDVSQVVRLSVADVKVSESGALEFLESGVLRNSASRWISLTKVDVTLEPRQSNIVECAISVPLSAQPGEYYSAVLVAMATPGRNEKGVVVQYRIASGIFVTVLGRTLPKHAKVGTCEVVWPQTASRAAATQPASAARPAPPELPKVLVALQNVGQARFDASGKITLLDTRSRIMFTAPLTSGRPCVFAGDTRQFEAIFAKPVPAGKYVIRVDMDYQSSWARARQELPVEILPAQAEMLLAMKKRLREESAVAEVLPEKISPTIPAGATRSLALAVRNISDGPIQYVASVSFGSNPATDSWITVRPQGFTIYKGGRQSVELKIEVPADTAAGRYFGMVSVEGGTEGSKLRKLEVPLEIEVITEK